MVMFLIVCSIIMAYATLGAFIGNAIHLNGKRKCRHVGTNRCNSDCGHAIGGAVGGVFWPIAFPVAMGLKASNVLANPEARVERRRETELAEAKHKAELARQARIHEQETTRRLEAMR